MLFKIRFFFLSKNKIQYGIRQPLSLNDHFNEVVTKWEVAFEHYFGHTTCLMGLCQPVQDSFNTTFEQFITYLIYL